MAYAVERPLPRLGTFSAQCKELKAAQQDAADRRAHRTLALAQYLASLRAAGLSLSRQRLLVEKAMEAGVLPPGSIPAREQIRRLSQRWDAGDRSAVDYRAKPRSGGPKKEWDRRITDTIVRECEETGVPDVAALHRRLKALAQQHQVACPSYATTARLVAARGRTAREAARHGARSAELSATVAGHVPTRWTHDTWTFDAFDAPWWAKGYCDQRQEWVSIKQTVIVVRDYKSGVVVGYLVVDPMRRRGPEGRRMRQGYDSDDVYAAFLSATCRELAPPATKAYAGHLCRRLRIDNHITHHALRTALHDLATAATFEIGWLVAGAKSGPTDSDADQPPPLVGVLAAEAERVPNGANVDVPRLPVLRPRNRGMVETAVRFLKGLCQDLPHSSERVVPIDRVGEDTLGHLRTKASNTTDHREVRRDPVDVRQLPTAEEAAELFDRVVRYFNEAHVNRLFGTTAHTRYHEFFPRHPRAGADALIALPSWTATVTADGITYERDGVRYAFAPEARWNDQRVRLPLDTLVPCKRDPLGRGVFARVLDKLVFCPPQYLLAQEPGRAVREAREQDAETRTASNTAVRRRAETFDHRYGEGAAKATGHVVAAQRALREAKRKFKEALASVPERPVSPAPGPPAPERPMLDIPPTPPIPAVPPVPRMPPGYASRPAWAGGGALLAGPPLSQPGAVQTTAGDDSPAVDAAAARMTGDSGGAATGAGAGVTLGGATTLGGIAGTLYPRPRTFGDRITLRRDGPMD